MPDERRAPGAVESVREYIHRIRNRVNAPIMKSAIARETAQEVRARAAELRRQSQALRAQGADLKRRDQ